MTPKEILTKEFLQREYVELKKSIKTIAKENNIASSNSVTQFLYKFNITRGKIRNPEKLFTKEFLEEEYINKKKGIKLIARESGRSGKGTVRTYLIKYNIPIRNYVCDEAKDNIEIGYEGIPGYYWKRIKRSALVRDIEFSINIEDMWELFLKQNKKCALSGIPISFGPSSCHSTTASLDRIDNKKGYIINNVQWVHKDINIMKNIFDNDYFIECCKKITENNK